MNDVGIFLIGMCVGIILMAILADKTNKAQVERLKDQIENDRKDYLQAVSFLEGEIKKMQDRISVLSGLTTNEKDNGST